jgi:hypothetical protein
VDLQLRKAVGIAVAGSKSFAPTRTAEIAQSLNAASKEFLAGARKEVAVSGPPAGPVDEAAKARAADFVSLSEEIVARFR